MTDMATSPEQALVVRVQELMTRLGELEDLEARTVADDLVGAVVEMYGDGLEALRELLDAIHSSRTARSACA